MPTRLAALVLATVALAAAVATSAPASEWHSFQLTALAYGTHGKCSHPATDARGGCLGTVASGSFEGQTLSGGVRWVWDHYGGTLEIVGRGFELRGSFPHHWTSFTVSTAAFGGTLFRSGTRAGEAGKPGGSLHLVLMSHSAVDAKSGKKVPGYTLRVVGFLESY